MGAGKKHIPNWKSSIDLNYVSDIANYRNPSVMSSSNYVIETYVQYGLLGMIIAVVAFVGVIYTANFSAQALGLDFTGTGYTCSEHTFRQD